MKFKHIDLSEYHYEDETEEIEDIVEGIEHNPALENIIPPKWHSLVNELIHDYENMNDSSFYENTKTIGIGQVWFLPQEYEEENEQKSIRKFNCVCPDGKRLYITTGLSRRFRRLH